MAKVYAYVLDNKVYINLTNRCTNACTFCIRSYAKTYDGYDLWLDEEPTYEQIMEQLVALNPVQYKELVFCGYGEPTYKWDIIKIICEYAHSINLKTRINTNGHANRILGRNICKEMAQNIDTINVSLNEADAKKYDKVCQSVYGEDAFSIMLEFAKGCVESGGNVVLSVVDCIGEEDINKAQEIADGIGAKLRVRKMI